jgi:hypothetical protein
MRPYTTSSSGEPMITIDWVQNELTPALGAILSGRPNHARMQLSATLDTLAALSEALRPSQEGSGDTQHD